MEAARQDPQDLRAVALRLGEIEKIKMELERRKARKRLFDFDPYPEQKEYMVSKARVCCLMASNRCITPWTFVETDRSKLHSVEFLTSKEKHVLSWDGESQCVAQSQNGFLKGIDLAFRLVLDNGQFFDCTGEHQVLTCEGYLPIDQLVSRASGLRCWRKLEDYQASCVEDGYLCDPQLLKHQDTFLARLLKQVGAQKLSRLSFSQEDVKARTHQYIRALSECDLLSTPDDALRFAGLFAQFSGPYVPQPFLPKIDDILSALRFVRESGHQLQATAGENSSHALKRSSETSEMDYGSASGSHTELCKPESILAGELSPYETSLGGLAPEWWRRGDDISILVPFDHPPLVGGRSIVAIVPIGYQPLIDFQVPDVHNYCAGGVYQHNCGKTYSAAHVTAYHLTGLYPEWWEGIRFDGPIDAWAVGVSSKTTMDVQQLELLGSEKGLGFGTGAIPGEFLLDTEMKYHIPGAVEKAYIRHITGGVSTLGFKAMEQGQAAFMGTKRAYCWIDEESDQVAGYDIFSECKTRTANLSVAQVLVTYTPLRGMNELAKYLIDGGANGNVDLYHIGWDDVPESVLPAAVKEELLRGYKPHEIIARTKGLPLLARDGAVYPFPESDVLVEPFVVPSHWHWVIGLDVARIGYYAAVLMATDPTTDTTYIVNTYKERERSREAHAEAVMNWGDGIYIGCDRSANQGDSDGTSTWKVFCKLGMNMHEANRGGSTEARIQAVFDRFALGKLKVFNTQKEWISEYRSYQYRKDKVWKHNDHLMDATQYGVVSLPHSRPLSYFRRNKYAQPTEYKWTPGDAVAGY